MIILQYSISGDHCREDRLLGFGLTSEHFYFQQIVWERKSLYPTGWRCERDRKSHGLLKRITEIMQLLPESCFMNPGVFKDQVLFIEISDEECFSYPATPQNLWTSLKLYICPQFFIFSCSPRTPPDDRPRRLKLIIPISDF